MTSFYRTTLPNGDQRLQEITVGQTIEVLGVKRRVVSMTVAEATEPDEKLGVEIGDLVTTLELTDADAWDADDADDHAPGNFV